MRVELFNVGWFTGPAGIWRKGDDMERQIRVPVPAYGIEAGEERILVDTAAAEDAERHYDSSDAISLFGLEQELLQGPAPVRPARGRARAPRALGRRPLRPGRDARRAQPVSERADGRFERLRACGAPLDSRGFRWVRAQDRALCPRP